MGTAKSLLSIQGKPILAYLLERLGWSGRGPTLLVTSPGVERPPGCELFDAEVVDAVPGEGPLRGMLTALEHATTETVVAVTVDMPGLALEHLLGLLRAGTMYSRRADGREVIEPFPCVIRQEMRTAIALRLSEGRRSVNALVEEPGVILVPAPAEWPARVWTNLNYPEDLRAFLDSNP